MKNISSIVDIALKKHLKDDIPELNYKLSNNLEVRLFPSSSLRRFKEAKRFFLKNYLTDLLVLNLGNVSMAAKKANLNRRHLHRILNDLEINPEEHRREMIKPSEYLKNNIHNILEDSLTGFGLEKVKSVYSNLIDISSIIAENMNYCMSFEEAMELFEKDFFTKVLKENNYDVQKTADAIDISERTLYRKISKLNLAIS